MGKQQSDKPQGRHAGKAGEQAGRRREPLRDNYYYEQPPRHSREPMEFEDISSSSQGGGEFQDISSYSSDRQRQQDQRELRQAPGRQPEPPCPLPGRAGLERRPPGEGGPEKAQEKRRQAGVVSRPGCAGGGPGGPGRGVPLCAQRAAGLASLRGPGRRGQRLFRQQGEEHRPVRGGRPGRLQRGPVRRAGHPHRGQPPGDLEAHLHPAGLPGVHRGLRLRQGHPRLRLRRAGAGRAHVEPDLSPGHHRLCDGELRGDGPDCGRLRRGGDRPHRRREAGDQPEPVEPERGPRG